MESYLPIFTIIPLLGLLLVMLPSNHQEKAIFRITITTVVLHICSAAFFTIFWLRNGFLALQSEDFWIYKTQTSGFAISFFFDRVTMVYGATASAITFMVALFSRYYMHREKGFKRFFINLLLFYLGINIIIFAGNFETLFVGWEVIGVASFLLIAFYRDRYLPVKNALKVVSLYRLADVTLLIAIWLCHHVFHKSIHFIELQDLQAKGLVVIENINFQFIIPLLFLVVAMVKSGQLPFSSWLPRAMEGPTTSSAIFYGSLSVHIGVFLLLRTAPLWQDNMLFVCIIIGVGLSTSIVTTLISGVQSSVKTQIAYSSLAQIGLIFVEVALGWHTLALWHFVGNAFLRTHQLLVSPSVLNYLIHDQFFNFQKPEHANVKTFLGRVTLSLYVLCVKEWNLDSLLYKWLWQPLKTAGKWLAFFKPKAMGVIFGLLFLVGLYLVYHQHLIPANFKQVLSEIFAFMGLVSVLKAFTERGDARLAWMLILINQLFTSLSIGFNERFDYFQVHIFLSGILLSASVGYYCLQHLHSRNASILLNQFHGHSYEYPRLTTFFLLACLGLSGFPITPTFLGVDLMIGHIHQNQIPLLLLTALNFILDGLAVYRILARVFLGQHDKTYHEVAYRSS